MDEILPPTPNVLLLIGPAGEKVVYLTTIEVAEADLALLAEFADALDRAAGPRPGPEFEALTEALGGIGRVPCYPWMPEGDEATVARWVRQALSTVLHSTFEGLSRAADRETLSNVLRYAEGWESVEVDQDEEPAAERALMSMMRAAGVHAGRDRVAVLRVVSSGARLARHTLCSPPPHGRGGGSRCTAWTPRSHHSWSGSTDASGGSLPPRNSSARRSTSSPRACVNSTRRWRTWR